MDTNERIVKLEENVKSNQHRLDEHDEQIKELRNVHVALTKVTDKVDNVEKDVSEMKSDIKVIKEKPAKNWDNLTKTILTRNCNCSSGLFFSQIWFIERGGDHEKSVDRLKEFCNSSNDIIVIYYSNSKFVRCYIGRKYIDFSN